MKLFSSCCGFPDVLWGDIWYWKVLTRILVYRNRMEEDLSQNTLCLVGLVEERGGKGSFARSDIDLNGEVLWLGLCVGLELECDFGVARFFASEGDGCLFLVGLEACDAC